MTSLSLRHPADINSYGSWTMAGRPDTFAKWLLTNHSGTINRHTNEIEFNSEDDLLIFILKFS